MESSFRGRLLRGESLSLPSSYRGVTLRTADSNWTTVGSFSELTYWNLEEVPGEVPFPNYQKDTVPQWMRWLEVATVLHSDQPSAILGERASASPHSAAGSPHKRIASEPNASAKRVKTDSS